ncbi:MAG: lytic transglycosylase domain-containing protein [Daejeonella sp.]
MIKKHLITCSVILVLFVSAKLFIYSTPATSYNSKTTIKKTILTEPKVDDDYYNSLTFANEELPLGDERVKLKMEQMLKAHNYQKIQTLKLHRKAAEWFPIIVPILQKYGIPEDFKYMPLVESGLLSGTSPKGASGYWQFMPQTARNFGLRVNSGVDERQLIGKSTIAACKYLKGLYKQFNSWTLAAAAYNIGEGGLKKQISRQNQDNYFKMKLNAETATYVYKLISMKEIIENPELYGYNTKADKTLAKLKTTIPERNPLIDALAEDKAIKVFETLQN